MAKPALRRDFGSFLSDAQPPAAPMRPQFTRVLKPTKADQVRTFLRAQRLTSDRWFMASEIAEALDLTMGEINGSVNHLVQLGEVERSLPPARANRKNGQTYRWRRP